MGASAEQGDLAGPLSVAVAELCRQLGPEVGPATARGLPEVLRRLAAPLQVAVAGRIKSGKSTLVNALIGRRVAPTAVGECTRLVTRYQYGTLDRVEVVFTDGRTQVLPFDDAGMIPADLGVDLGQVSHLEAYLTNAVLHDLTVIDTPGLGSLDSAAAARAERVLDGRLSAGAEPSGALDTVSQRAVAGAEAVLYVVAQAPRADDAAALAAFAAATAGRDAGPVNAIGVFTKADTVVPDSVPESGGDLWRAATLLAEHQAELLRPRVADVLPMIGLLAETAETGGLTHADVTALRELAAIDAGHRDTMLISPDVFIGWDCPVPAEARARLLAMLDLYGIRRALAALDAEPELTTGEVRRLLVDWAGLGALRARLADVFQSRADGIKAAAALASVTALARASGDAAERQRVHDAIEALLAEPAAHQLRVLEALTVVSSGAVDLPADLAAEVMRVGGSADPGSQLGLPGRPAAELAAHALERAGWWRSYASFGATPAQSRIAHVVHRAYFLLWQQLQAATP